MGAIYQAYGVDMDLKHGAIVHVVSRVVDGRFEVLNINEVNVWETRFGKDTPTHKLVHKAQRLASQLSIGCRHLAIEWDRNRVYYKGARKSAVVQVATMIGAFLGAATDHQDFFDLTPAMKARVLKGKVSDWTEFATQTKIRLVNPERYPEIDPHGDVADAAAVALYYIKTKLLGEEI